MLFTVSFVGDSEAVTATLLIFGLYSIAAPLYAYVVSAPFASYFNGMIFTYVLNNVTGIILMMVTFILFFVVPDDAEGAAQQVQR